jgi:protein-S-isoprenylcysteine O-methyltransferase Ste14
MDLAHAIVLLAYVAMALELRFIAVPSVVSTRQRLRRAQDSSPAAKLALVTPIVLINGLFLIPPVLVFAPGLIAYLGPIPQLAVPVVRWIGVALLVFGKLLPPLSLPPLRRALDEGLLARSGLFAYSRHPGLVGMFAFYLGNALVFPCALLLAGFPCYVLYMHRRALMEEAYLRERFPGEYEKYATHVPRYVGIRSSSPSIRSGT